MRIKCNCHSTGRHGGEPAVVVEQFELALQHNVAAFMDNELNGMPQVTQRSGRPLKTIAAIKGKEGRIRGNLMGKHDFFLDVPSLRLIRISESCKSVCPDPSP
jgi:DNA-directed RNA polymerase beta' subunit